MHNQKRLLALEILTAFLFCEMSYPQALRVPIGLDADASFLLILHKHILWFCFPETLSWSLQYETSLGSGTDHALTLAYLLATGQVLLYSVPLQNFPWGATKRAALSCCGQRDKRHPSQVPPYLRFQALGTMLENERDKVAFWESCQKSTNLCCVYSINITAYHFRSQALFKSKCSKVPYPSQ